MSKPFLSPVPCDHVSSCCASCAAGYCCHQGEGILPPPILQHRDRLIQVRALVAVLTLETNQRLVELRANCRHEVVVELPAYLWNNCGEQRGRDHRVCMVCATEEAAPYTKLKSPDRIVGVGADDAFRLRKQVSDFAPLESLPHQVCEALAEVLQPATA